MKLSTKQKMNRIYKNLCGFEISKEDSQAVKQSFGSPVYGEIMPTALDKLLGYINLNKNDVFYDLGSGAGKVVLQTALSFPVKKAVGIELSKERFEQSCTALKRAYELGFLNNPKVSFKNIDLMKANLNDATVIYCCSTAFSQKFMNKIVKYLSCFRQSFRLLSLQDLPETKNFELVNILKLDMSWTRKTSVHIYQKKL